ncbi:Di-copper centre-containing protein [Gloeophyllum trabeum ATCC 11539]|uniref:Di-copper centre-containing protein n=1 Tax=Gloeophyllum trabeum (strain ATCC 11539 / FP-39264 / Madison 617) TaxID=670483 RepID=S7RR67_GLOTA|nr:Di-copper centre-containing protein [Gloeophyllum trabeum ATCC 11539]EPQ57105.1 Di-copper centre-containing protein [Gloeophyllum trabeum ATCC 11539]
MYSRIASLVLAALSLASNLLPVAQVDEAAEVILASPIVEAFSAQCTKPSVRREWRKLSRKERADYIRAVNCLDNLPHSPDLRPTVFPDDIPPVNESASLYDDFVYIHMDLNRKIHYTALLLPWHRCDSGEYSDAPDFQNSDFWKDPDPVSGLGGWGDPSKDYAVTDGGFAGFRLSYPTPHVLRRNFTLQPHLSLPRPYAPDPELYANETFTAAEVEKMVTGFKGDMIGFQRYLGAFTGSHNSLHVIVGGDLGGQCPTDAPPGCISGPTFSANDPLFWLHHAMVDKIWYDWQRNDPVNFWTFQGGSVQVISNYTEYEMWPSGAPPLMNLNDTMPTDGMFPEMTVYDVMNTTGGYLCYVYE